MKRDNINNEIEMVINEKNKLWGLFLVTLGVTLMLALNIHNKLKFFLVIPGFIISILLLIIYRNKNNRIEKLLLNQEEDKE